MSPKEFILSGKPLHFLPDAPAEVRTIEAQWIVDAAALPVPVDISKAIIKGTLDFTRAVIINDLFLRDCSIEGRICFSNSEVQRELNLSGSTLLQGVDFQQAIFHHFVRLNDVKVHQGKIECVGAEFRSALFGNNMVLDEDSCFNFVNAECLDAIFMKSSKFNGGIHFFHTRCKSLVDLSQSSFNTKIVFLESAFDKSLAIRDANFQTTAYFQVVTAHELDVNRSKFQFVKLVGNEIRSVAAFQGAVFDGSIEINNCIFTNQLNFTAAVFKSDFSINGVEIHHGTHFKNCTFEGDAEFRQNVFGNSVDFVGAKFPNPDKQINFYGSRFKSDCDFIDVEVHAKFIFRSVFVDRYGNFEGAKFNNAASFESARMSGAAFCNTVFKQDANFCGIQIDNVNFEDSLFEGDAFFELCRFKNLVSFAGAVFRGKTRFNFGTFEQACYFKTTRFEDDVSFAFAKFSNPNFSPNSLVGEQEQFLKSVTLQGCTYDYIDVDWKKLAAKINKDTYSRQPYVQLEGVLKRHGYEEDANDLYYHRKKVEAARIKFSKTPFTWLNNRILWILTGYGIRLQRLVYAVIVVLMFGTFIFSRDQAVMLVNEKTEETLSVSNAFWFAVDVLLPVDLPIGKKYQANDLFILEIQNSFGFRYDVIATLMELFGWILIPIAIAGLTGFLKR